MGFFERTISVVALDATDADSIMSSVSLLHAVNVRTHAARHAVFKMLFVLIIILF